MLRLYFNATIAARFVFFIYQPVIYICVHALKERYRKESIGRLLVPMCQELVGYLGVFLVVYILVSEMHFATERKAWQSRSIF